MIQPADSNGAAALKEWRLSPLRFFWRSKVVGERGLRGGWIALVRHFGELLISPGILVGL